MLDIFGAETIQHFLDTAKSAKDKNWLAGAIKKLRVKFKTEKDKLKKSGTSRPKREWKFVEKMDAIYKENPSMVPVSKIEKKKHQRVNSLVPVPKGS